MAPLQTMKQQNRITMPHFLKNGGKQSKIRNTELVERKSTHENSDSYKHHSMECGLPTVQQKYKDTWKNKRPLLG
jgi:hypothetical protein